MFNGKVIVVLINDPPVADPSDPTKLDEKTFKGKAMTYYGRWTYKFEEAAAKGAVGSPDCASDRSGGLSLGRCPDEQHGRAVQPSKCGRRGVAVRLRGLDDLRESKGAICVGREDFDALEKSAATRDFRPVDLQVKASLGLRNTIRTIDSKNVVGKLEGADPKLRDEYVIYTAHWDHLGIGPEVNGDKIYHGALDNASGVAGLVELADALAHAQPPPRRSILLLSVTAEEKGLLGSQYYAEHPLYPLSKTLADINMDGLNRLGPYPGH